MSDRNHIFLSYASQEHTFATKLAVDLKNAGVNVWMDRIDIDLGGHWRNSLQNGITASAALLAILSQTFVHSQYCQHELARADRLGYPIIPILLTPIATPDWPIEIERRQYIDFTQWREERMYIKQLARLVAYLKDKFRAQNTRLPGPEARYLTSLTATLRDRNSIDTQVAPNERPEPFATFEWNLETTQASRKRTTGLLSQLHTLSSRQTSLTNQILRNFATNGQLALVGDPGTGKTSLMDYLGLKLAQQRQAAPRSNPLPIFIRAADWHDTMLLADLVKRVIPRDVNLTNPVLCVDGLDELQSEVPRKLAQLRDWLHAGNKMVITCRSNWFVDQIQLPEMPTVITHDLETKQVQLFLASVFSPKRADQILDNYPGKHLQALLRNPRNLNLLAKINYRLPLENVGAALQQLVTGLYNRSPSSNVPFKTVEQALAQLAADDNPTIAYHRALQIFESQAALMHCERAGLLNVTEVEVSFTYPMFRSYFAAVWLRRTDTQWQLLHARDDIELIVLCLAGISAAPDELVNSIYLDYPELAMHCLVTDVTAATVQTVFTHWLRSWQSIELPILPYIPTLPDALINMMKGETWPIRQSAHQTLQQLPVTYMTGIVEMLSLGEDERGDAALALKQIGTRALPTLIQHLRHDNIAVRRNVVWALDELSDKACVPGLVELLGDPDPVIVMHAIQALGYLRDDDAYPALVNALGHPNVDVQQTAFDTLAWSRESATAALIRGSGHHNSVLRQYAVRLLAENMAEDVTAALIKATYDTDPNVQLSAIAALKERESPETVDRLSECLQNPQLRATAMEVLRYYQNPRRRPIQPSTNQPVKKGSAAIAKQRIQEALTANPAPEVPPRELPPAIIAEHTELVDHMLERLQNSDWGEREEAAKALRDYAKTLQGENVPHIVNKLTPLLKSEDWVLRWAAIEPLAWIKHNSSVPDFIALLEDDHMMVRIAAIRGLQELKHPSAISAIQERLNDPQNLVREAALEALGLYGDKRLIASIAPLLDDPDEMIRLAAAQALSHINHKSIVPLLVKALDDDDKHVRWVAVDGLREVADTSAVNSLVHRLNDEERPHWEEERICDIAATILDRIGTSTAKEAVAKWRQRQADSNSPGK